MPSLLMVFNGQVTLVLRMMGREFLTRFPPTPSFFSRVRHDKPGVIKVFMGVPGRKQHEVTATACGSKVPHNTQGSGLRRVWEVEDEPSGVRWG